MIADIRAFVTAAVVCVLVVLTVHALQAGPISPAGTAKSYGAGLLFDYQTLITGLLAIVAAFITVREMRRADRQSDKRHQESMDLAIRGDRLKVERAVYPQIAELSVILSHLMALHDLTRKVKHDAAARRRAAGRWVHIAGEDDGLIFAIYPLIGTLAEILVRPQFEEGARLFDGDLTYQLWKLTEATKNAHVAGAVIYRYHRLEKDERTNDDDHEYVRAAERGDFDLIIDFPERFAPLAVKVVEGMNRMADLYNVRGNSRRTL